MRIITKKHLPRRTFLRGMMGATVALPLLDSMVPALRAATIPKTRLGFVYVPHGAVANRVMDHWTPAAEGAGFEFTPILKPLEPFRNRVTVITGLANKAAESQGDGGGDHARAAPAFLSADHPLKSDGNLHAGVTIDQIAAQRIGQDTPLPSLEVGIEDTGLVGNCDVGYSCGYMNSIAWRTPSTPLPMEVNPRVVFERLFGDGSSVEQRLAWRNTEKSILDSVVRELGTLQGGLGSYDRNRVNEYLEDIREIERRIQRAEKQNQRELAVPDAPVGIPDTFDEHAKLMFDLQVLAYQAEITRISTFMLARDLSPLTFPVTGVPDAFHGVSHHGDDIGKLTRLSKINTYHVQLLAYFMEKLQSKPDGDGTLLDHTMILYGSSMGNPNEHNHAPVPIVLAGGASGQLRGGRHLKCPDRTSTSNLLLTVLNKAGIPTDKLGDSTGILDV
jgi:hypothetical protein